MNQNPQLEPLDTEIDLQKKNLTLERKLSDRILAWAFGASVVVNIVWIIAVSHSNLFGGSVIPPMKETEIKVFKRPPPPPKTKPKPPPPPPKHHPPPPQKPLPRLTHPTPPQPPHHQVTVATTNNRNTTNQNTAISAPASDDQSPTTAAPGPPSPPAPPAPPTPPAPPSAPPPAPAAPPAPPPPPPPPPPRLPPPPPPPPARPRNYSPIGSQEAGPVGDYAEVHSPEGLDITTLSSTTVTVSYEIDVNGHASGVHVTKSCGNSDMDQACADSIRQTQFQPAIQDHIKLRSSENHVFNVGAG